MRVFGLVLVGLLGAAVAINVSVAWGRRWINPATAMLVYRDVDDRLAKKAVVMLRPRPRVVVFGSSRALGITSRVAGVASDEFLNAAVGGAAVEDYAGLWSLLKRQGKAPDLILFSVDPWVFSQSQPPARWRSLAPEVAAFQVETGVDGRLTTVVDDVGYRWDAFTDLFSFTVLRASVRDLRSLLRVPRARTAEVAAAIADDEGYGRNWATLPAEEIRRRAVEYGRQGGGVTDPRWDERRAQWLQRLWADMRAHGVLIAAYVPPYHPDAWAAVRQDPAHRAFLDIVERFLDDISGRLGVTFLDLADPAVIPCTADQFWDGHHPTSACLTRIANRLRWP